MKNQKFISAREVAQRLAMRNDTPAQQKSLRLLIKAWNRQCFEYREAQQERRYG